jgi:predicted Zn-dependent peptidase
LRGIYLQVELDGVTEEELQQAKNKGKARVVLGSERPQNRLFNVGGNWLQRHEYRTVADDLKALDDVTVVSVRGVLERYPLTRTTTIAVGPQKDVQAPA